MAQGLVIGRGEEPAILYMDKLNRHGLIAGATGTGKTVTLKVMAEKLSEAGIPVFMADVKGDLASVAEAGERSDKIMERVNKLQIEGFELRSFPVELLDIFGMSGVPVRTTVSDMGPILLSRLLGLNETQEGILNIAFKVADEKQLLIIDLKDLKAILNFVGDNAAELRREYGNISKQSIGAILRGLLVIEEQGGDTFFGEPMFDIKDLLRVDSQGRGIVNVLMASKLFMSPKLYSTFLLWFLSELYEQLPEVGDLEKPKIVFFFDEAHVLFQDIPDVLEEKIELIVRLIRSKGVGIFFITQNPTDLPNVILSQLGNKVQHALRAFTPKEQKTVKAVADTFRQHEGENLEKKLTELKVGEALVSFLDSEGIPGYVQQVMIYPPESKMGILDPLVKEERINHSLLYMKYGEMIDRESSYEQLQRLAEIKAVELEENEELAAREKEKEEQLKQRGKERAREESLQKKTKPTNRDTTMDRFTKNLMSQFGKEVGRVISRGILGILKK
jgi:uncharacterized protein